MLQKNKAMFRSEYYQNKAKKKQEYALGKKTRFNFYNRYKKAV